MVHNLVSICSFNNNENQILEYNNRSLRSALIVGGLSYSGLYLSRNTYWFCNLLAENERMREIMRNGLENRSTHTFLSNRCVQLRSALIHTINRPMATTAAISLATFLFTFFS